MLSAERLIEHSDIDETMRLDTHQHFIAHEHVNGETASVETIQQ